MNNKFKFCWNNIKFKAEYQDNSAIFIMQEPNQIFLKNIDITKHNLWKQSQLCQKYTVVKRQKQIEFIQILPFAHENHELIQKLLLTLFSNYCQFQINFQIDKYNEFMQNFKMDIQEELQSVIFHEETVQNVAKKFIFFVQMSSKKQIQNKLNKILNILEDTVIFPCDEYLKNKRSLKNQNYSLFMREFVNIYKQKLIKQIYEQIIKFFSKKQIIISKIESVQARIDNTIYQSQIQHGIKLNIKGNEHVLSKVYQTIQNFLIKCNFQVISSTQLRCCRKQEISTWFYQKYKSHAFLLNNKIKQQIKILVFQPKQNISQIKKQLSISKHIITRKNFPNFHLFAKYEKDLKKIFHQRSRDYQNYQLCQQFMVIQCNQSNYIKLQDYLKQFLNDHSSERKLIQCFKDILHINILNNCFKDKLKSHKINIKLIDNKLQIQSMIKDSQKLEEAFKDYHQQIVNQMVTIPIDSPLPKQLEYVRITEDKQWASINNIKSMTFLVDNLLQITLRNLTNLPKNIKSILILPRNSSQYLKCKLYTQNFPDFNNQKIQDYTEKMVKRNSIFSRIQKDNQIYFWFIEDSQRQVKVRLKSEIQSLIKLGPQNIYDYTLIIPSISLKLIKVATEYIIKQIMKISELNKMKRKYLNIYFQKQNQNQLKNQLIIALKNLKKQYNIQKINDLHLNLQTILKINQYKYYQIKYFQKNKTYSSSSINSFIFNHVRSKAIKTPIFLPNQQNKYFKDYKQYLVSMFSPYIWQIQGKKIVEKEIVINQYKNLSKIIKTFKKYFSKTDYLVIYGNLQNDSYDLRLFFASSQQKMYKCLQQLEINTQNETIVLSKYILNYEMTNPELTEYLKLQTHKSKLQQIYQLRKYKKI